MIKITDLLAAQSRDGRESTQDATPVSQGQGKVVQAVAIPAYPSKKLALKDGQYVATDHK